VVVYADAGVYPWTVAVELSAIATHFEYMMVPLTGLASPHSDRNAGNACSATAFLSYKVYRNAFR
jgi:hypothetical protein